MKITETIDWRLCISDIETCKELMDFGFYNPDEDKWYEFEISKYKNDLYEFVKFYNKSNWEYIVFYNGLGFDGQVIQFILNNYNTWFDLKNQEIIDTIYEFVQALINDQKYSNFKPYKESQFEIPIIDVYTLLGLENLARISSLKKIEFNLDFFNVEEMPIHHSKENLTKQEIQEIKDYRKNDVLATYEIFKLCLGDTDHKIYKHNNQIELRLSIQQEFGINCISYSDIKIGESIMKSYYMKEKGLTEKEFPRKGTFRKQILLKNCIPSYVEFKTEYFKNLLKKVKAISIKQDEEFKQKLVFYKREYTLGRGGLHSDQSNEVFKVSEDILIEDDDAASYYPKIIINNGYYPKHLGKELLKVYETLYNKRVELKPLAKKDNKIKGITEALKLSLNSVFGKLGSMDSWLYDAQTLFSVTLTGEFSLLMLIEEFELNGINVISCNSDGVTTRFHKDKKELKDKIVKEWQEKTNFEIETVSFKTFYYSSVNNYLAIKDDDSVKLKGLFIKDFELWKNKSNRVIPLALEEYFINGKDPIEFINNHDNIYDFCIMGRAKGNLHLEEIEENKEPIVHKKLIRYYLSTDSKTQLVKRGIGSTGKNINICLNASNELSDIFIKYFNIYEKKEMKDYFIDYKNYIYRVLKIIDGIEKTKKAKSFRDKCNNNNQLTLF